MPDPDPRQPRPAPTPGAPPGAKPGPGQGPAGARPRGGPIAPPAPEVTVWEGRSSHWMHTGLYTLCILFCWLLVPIYIGLRRYLITRCTVYTLTSQRLRTTQGVFSQRVDELELYRVKDITLLRPFAQRLMGLGTVVITTSDQTTPTVVLAAVHDSVRVKDLVRENTERERDRKRVTEVDLT